MGSWNQKQNTEGQGALCNLAKKIVITFTGLLVPTMDKLYVGETWIWSCIITVSLLVPTMYLLHVRDRERKSIKLQLIIPSPFCRGFGTLFFCLLEDWMNIADMAEEGLLLTRSWEVGHQTSAY